MRELTVEETEMVHGGGGLLGAAAGGIIGAGTAILEGDSAGGADLAPRAKTAYVGGRTTICGRA